MYYMLFWYKYTNNVFPRLILRFLFILRLLSFPRTQHGFQSLFLWASKAPYFFENALHDEVESGSASVHRFLRKALNETLPCHQGCRQTPSSSKYQNGLCDKADSNNLSKLRPTRTLTRIRNLTFKSLEQQQSYKLYGRNSMWDTLSMNCHNG